MSVTIPARHPKPALWIILPLGAVVIAGVVGVQLLDDPHAANTIRPDAQTAPVDLADFEVPMEADLGALVARDVPVPATAAVDWQTWPAEADLGGLAGPSGTVPTTTAIDWQTWPVEADLGGLAGPSGTVATEPEVTHEP